MAISVRALPSLTAVRIIASVDDAIDQAASDVAAYKESGDEAKLVFLPGKTPTVFLCNFQLDAKAARIVNNAMLSARGDDGKPSMAFGTWAQTIAKVTLKEIVAPDDQPDDQRIQLRKDSVGYAADETLAVLERFGIIDDIFAIYLALQKKTKTAADAKN